MKEGVDFLDESKTGYAEMLESVVLIHAACILYDHTMASFIPPLSFERMATHWHDLAKDVKHNQRIILVYVSKVSSRTPTATNIDSPFPDHPWRSLPFDEDLEVSGVVTLAYPDSETGPFRGMVGKLFVSPLHRRKRIATRLLAALEKEALRLGKWSLLLDTTVGTPAEHVYPRLGYEKLGVIREYGLSPVDGKSLLDEVFYCKDLRKGTLSIADE